MTAPIADQSAEQLPRPTRLSDVKGWFFTADQLLFDWFLAYQQDRSERGDLLELGAYMGKSAIFLGARLRDGERFTVCDLFDSPAEDASNSKEMKKSYATLTRRAFEANYLAFHDELPTIVQGLSSVVSDHVEAGSVRFAHIDASHLYEHVHGDILAVRELLSGSGVVVLDDYRAEHCPGVAAATWQAVSNEGLRPICITGTKFYGTWGDPEPLQKALVEWIKGRGDIWHEVQYVNDAPLVRLSAKGAKEPAQPVSRYKAAPAARVVPGPAAREPRASAARPVSRPPVPTRGTVRKVALDVLPPIVTRAIVRARRRARTR
ncbi:class I SAM-dependent methyltransferase [Streptomyces lydicus]|uniref:class I SAM-dependent methyltransferase n=1 Tax=Streptomyces lydicus TaxID=47763 RepID=UPI0005259C3A|nr:class I SAM-dependent methyltransferase [Streptomyces lydicus]MDC7338715.1 class I SAM-dependent methyltransferase [Streptomyces lydicus]UEG91806.1 class I SAM-dependent methyltransferase [Streptomyces lydicus]